jgi:hypothetical protein
MNDMAELFARDPREHSDEDFKKIVAHLRELRHRFVFEGKPAGPAKLTSEQQKVSGLDLNIKL